MSQLYERYRPATLDAVVGQSETVKALKTLLARNFSGGAFYFIGASGTGKTSLAKAVVNDLAIDGSDVTELGGADCSVEFVRETVINFGLSTWGASGWKAVIVNEAQAMTPRAIQAWLPFLEELPPKRLVIFTSTEPLDADMFGNFTGPMASRCKVFMLEADAEAFAAHVATIASAENLNGQPLEAYRALLQRCGGNMRAAFQRVEAGEMLKPHIDRPAPVTTPAPAKVKSAAAKPTVPASPHQSPAIASELAYGAKLFKGSKKHKLHVDRLKALYAAVEA